MSKTKPAPTGAALTVAQIAAELNVTQTIVLSWIGSGELRAVNASSSPAARRPTWRVLRADLDEFLAARTPAPQQPKTRRRSRVPDDVTRFF